MDFYLDPREIDTRDLATGIQTIQLTRLGGEMRTIDPAQTPIDLRQEHPPVERMEADLGAICEVFRQSSSYYLSLPGISLAPGDRLTLTYYHQRHTVTLSVAELENGRVRIEPPVVRAAGG